MTNARRAHNSVELLPKLTNVREVVLVGTAVGNTQPDTVDPCVEPPRASQPLDRCPKSSSDGGNQIQREAAAIKAELTDQAVTGPAANTLLGCT